MDKILFEQIPDLFASVGDLFIEKKEELCEMDARLGDGDLGLTMSKGYGSLPDIMRQEADGAAGDAGKLLMKSGMKMSSLVPSTMGFLMSTGIMEGGKALKGKTEIDAAGLAAYLTGFAAGVQKRGKCEPGQRTIYDSILPAAQAADKAAKEASFSPGSHYQSTGSSQSRSGINERYGSCFRKSRCTCCTMRRSRRSGSCGRLLQNSGIK